MKRNLGIAVSAGLVTLGLVGLALFAVARTGVVNVAATADDVPGVAWFFGTLSEASIRRQAAAAVERGEIRPAESADEAMLRLGAAHYRAMCVTCHGGPGVEKGETGAGMRPEPPDLAHAAGDMSDAEILWVLHHGIRHTGMPAFGDTHSAADLQAIAALVSRFDGLSPEEYRRLAGPGTGHDDTTPAAAAEEHDHGDHVH